MLGAVMRPFLMKMHSHCKPLKMPCERCLGCSLPPWACVPPCANQRPAFREEGLDRSSFLHRRRLPVVHSEITANKPLPRILSLTFHIAETEGCRLTLTGAYDSALMRTRTPCTRDRA